VKDMAGCFRIRIELRQIGQLDVIRAFSDYQHCGRELCCRAFLKTAESVSAHMVKVQKNTMDPAKLKGQCGRRMCCLSYEDAVYTALQKDMPNEGDIIRTNSIEGMVKTVNLIKQEVVILFQQGDKTEYITVKKEEIVEIKVRDWARREDAFERRKAEVQSGAIEKEEISESEDEEGEDKN
jgi:cell fate regulator YaaT (PSP1 superfamily)